MRVGELSRSSGFRFAALVLAILGIASLTSFSFLYVDTTRFLDYHLDAWLRREQASLLALDRGELADRVQRHDKFDFGTEWPIALYDPQGRVIAGVPIALPPERSTANQPFVFRARISGEAHRYRGLVEQLPDGDILLISERLWWASSLNQVLIERTVLGLSIAAALGLGIAAVLQTRARRRIASITTAAQQIVSGDLSRRLPILNNSDDVDRLAGVVNWMLNHIERLVLQIASFRDAVSHDLTTPLTRLHVTLESAQVNATTLAAYASSIADALEESRRLARMLAAIRRLSEIESGARRAAFAMVDLEAIATEAFDFYQPVADERGISLCLVNLGHSCTIMGDYDLLFEALGNLLDNAIKFTPSAGLVTLMVFEGDEPGFEVIDNGPGIPASEQTSVLRRFYRQEGSRTIPGTGLGLALVSAIAELHGMELRIRSGTPGCTIVLRGAASSAAFA